jgi:Mrp family chromosome partitioning ATPase
VSQIDSDEPQDSVPPGPPSQPNQQKRNFIRRIIKDVKWGELDFLLCDFPSGTNEEQLTLLRMLRQIQPDGAVILSNPQNQSYDAVRKSVEFCHKTNINIIGIVENMRLCKCQVKDKTEEELKDLCESSVAEKIALDMQVLNLGSIRINKVNFLFIFA